MDEKEREERRSKTATDFLEGAVDCPQITELFDELDTELSEQTLDESQLRRQEDWSNLSNQMVGAESGAQ